MKKYEKSLNIDLENANCQTWAKREDKTLL